MSRFKIIVLLALVGAMPLLLEAERTTHTIVSVQNHKFDQTGAFIRALIKKEDVPSFSVAVAQGGNVIWEQSYGWADRENKIPATPNTMYPVACSSFIADGIMKLVEEGKIDLDKPINDYLGEAKFTSPSGDASGATVRRVLSNTAGLGYYYRYVFQNDQPNLNDAIARYGVLMHEPGESFRQSSLGYQALGYVIERVSGMKYADYMRQHIYLPLGMVNTADLSTPDIKAGPAIAPRYNYEGQVVPFYVFGDHLGSVSAYSSIHDMARYAMFHLKDHTKNQKPILKDETIDAMHKAEIQDSPDWGFGLGWMAEEDHGYAVAGAGGGTLGVATVLDLYPAENLAIVTLSNSQKATILELGDQVRNKVLEILLPKYAAAVAVAEAKKSATSASPKPKRPAFVPPPELAGEWDGAVRMSENRIPITLVFNPAGDAHVKVGNRSALLKNVRFNKGNVAGMFDGPMPTPDVGHGGHIVLLDIRLRGDKMNGSILARDDLYALPFYVELTRKE